MGATGDRRGEEGGVTCRYSKTDACSSFRFLETDIACSSTFYTQQFVACCFLRVAVAPVACCCISSSSILHPLHVLPFLPIPPPRLRHHIPCSPIHQSHLLPTYTHPSPSCTVPTQSLPSCSLLSSSIPHPSSSTPLRTTSSSFSCNEPEHHACHHTAPSPCPHRHCGSLQRLSTPLMHAPV